MVAFKIIIISAIITIWQLRISKFVVYLKVDFLCYKKAHSGKKSCLVGVKK